MALGLQPQASTRLALVMVAVHGGRGGGLQVSCLLLQLLQGLRARFWPVVLPACSKPAQGSEVIW